MRKLDPHHDPQPLAFPDGVIAVLAVVLIAIVLPASAADTSASHERSAALSVCEGPHAASEQALQRVPATPAGATLRIVVHAAGSLPVPISPAAARCDARPRDLFGLAGSTSGIPLRILFCTWLN